MDIDKKLGPTFAQEVADAGLRALPFLYSDNGVNFAEGIRDEDRQRIIAVVEAHDPTRTSPNPVVPINLGVRIKDWQFFTMLAFEGVITSAEALATNSGQMPKLLNDAIDATITDPQQRLAAQMKVGSTTDFYRNDQMVALVAGYLTSLGTHGVWDDARLDALWDSAGKLT